MRSLPKPTLPPEEIFLAAIGTMHRQSDRTLHLAELANVAALGTLYDDTLSVTDANALIRSQFTLGGLTSEQMGRVYSYRLRRIDSPIRYYYDDVLAATDDDICPYCGERGAMTVDHYVPQAKFSALNVTPSNLVPACRDCNHDKGAYEPGVNRPAILHPYFDSIDHLPWLGVKIGWPASPARSSAPTVDYEVDASVFASHPTLRSRVMKHFDLLKLRQLYRTKAGQRLNELERRLPGVFRSSQASGIRKHLAEEASAGLAYSNNYWERRLHLALIADNHYCEKHFDRP
ncbi:HNH endonuclease [Curtobacterium aetherium]|uniref:HNH endonuclease n=1 Tax=Curtobacterium aetherium TaxID=2841594 RepID=A0ACD1E142_9MICO|nr:HNH endonuclease [Curtobacterium sp. L6-1]QWS32549.1 HNH endonuclease [Curtobacterium sp. L6-1]